MAVSSLVHAAAASAIAVRTAGKFIDLTTGSLAAMPNEPDDKGSTRPVPTDDPRVIAATIAVQAGDLDALEHLLTADPWLASARIGDASCYRTLLHTATDWPGHYPNGPAVVARLVAAGADVNAHSRFSHHTETPLHWAASSDDVAVLDALLDSGADIEASGAMLGGGTPLSDASGFGNWAAAKRLVERGAATRLSDAAGLGLLDRLEMIFAQEPGPDREEITQALWSACNGGQLAAAQYLVDHGADINWIGWDDKTPLDLVEKSAQPELSEWLRTHGAKGAKELRAE